jgi:hypothetical protein
VGLVDDGGTLAFYHDAAASNSSKTRHRTQ